MKPQDKKHYISLIFTPDEFKILNDYFELRSLVELIQKYDSEKDYVLEEIKELGLIEEGLNKIID